MKTRKVKYSEFVPAATLNARVALDYPDCFAPVYEDNARGVLHVCICDGCEDAKPRLKELAKLYKLAVNFKDDFGNIRPVSDLFKKK
jgi:hypothetical protein